jgi:hypothetical protein
MDYLVIHTPHDVPVLRHASGRRRALITLDSAGAAPATPIGVLAASAHLARSATYRITLISKIGNRHVRRSGTFPGGTLAQRVVDSLRALPSVTLTGFELTQHLTGG